MTLLQRPLPWAFGLVFLLTCAACAHLQVPPQVSQRAPGTTILLGNVEMSENHGSLEFGQLLREQLRAELEEAAFHVTSDASVAHDFELTVSGAVKTQHIPFECVLGCNAVGTMVVASNGNEVTRINGSTDLSPSDERYMKNLAVALVNSLVRSDQFVDALAHHPARVQLATANAGPAAPATAPRLLAVLPLTVRAQAMDEPTRETLEEAIRTVAGDALSQYGYTVLTGENTLRILADNGVDTDKVCEANCALEAARELKANLFLSGSVAKEGSGYVVFIRLFSQERGQQLASVQIEGASPRDLRHSFDSQAAEFFRKGLAMSGQ